jgi:glycosyltransferase involved in cell wall biosynthesis
LAELGRAIEHLRADHLYVAYGDGLTTVAGLARVLGRRFWPESIGAEVLLMRGGYQYPQRKLAVRLRDRVAPNLIGRAPFDRVHHLDSDDVDALRAANLSLSSRFRLMPDPIERLKLVSHGDARRSLGIPEKGRYIGCAGLLDARKGIDLLLRAFAAVRGRLAPDDRVLLAGLVQPEIRAVIEHELPKEMRQQIVTLDRFLSTAELNTAIAAMDVVCTPYPHHLHSVSIVIRAAAARRMVLATGIGWMHRTVRQFSLGRTCDVRDIPTFADAIVSSLRESESFIPREASRRFIEFHAADNFASHWVAHLRERLGLPLERALIEWDWVLEALD